MTDNKLHLTTTPGLKTTDGEQIINKLVKLWKKINSIEKSSTKIKSEKDVQVDFHEPDADMTLDEVQCKLLQLQLKYLRSIVHKKVETINGTSVEKQQTQMEYPSPSLNDSLDLYPVKLNSDKLTQITTVESSPVQHIKMSRNRNEKSKPCRNRQTATDDLQCNNLQSQPHIAATTETHQSISTQTITGTASTAHLVPDSFPVSEQWSSTQKLFNSEKATTAPGHFHLNLSEMPFILGTYSGESHSVIANLQTAIGLMKNHNRLCQGFPFVRQKDRSSTYESLTCNNASVPLNCNLKKLLIASADELSHLTQRYDELKNVLDAKHSEEETESVKQEYLKVSELIKSKSQEIINLEKAIKSEIKPEKQRSRSLSATRLRESEQKHKLQKNSCKNEKVHTGNIKNTSCIDRRKIMLSLKQLQSELQSSDVLWCNN